jgi:hypothetical protein
LHENPRRGWETFETVTFLGELPEAALISINRPLLKVYSGMSYGSIGIPLQLFV